MSVLHSPSGCVEDTKIELVKEGKSGEEVFDMEALQGDVRQWCD